MSAVELDLDAIAGRVANASDRCGYAMVEADGEQQPCDREATGWRWYQDVEHEDALDVACDWHENVGGNTIRGLLAEVERLRACEDEYAELVSRLSSLLTGVANALKGPPPPLTGWDWSDLPVVAAKARAALAGMVPAEKVRELAEQWERHSKLFVAPVDKPTREDWEFVASQVRALLPEATS